MASLATSASAEPNVDAAVAAEQRGDWETAFVEWSEAADEAADIDDPPRELGVLLGAARALHQLGRYEEALALLEKAEAHTADSTPAALRAAVAAAMGEAHSALSDRESSQAAFERALRLAREALDPGTEAVALLGLGKLHGSEGDHAGAAKLLRDAAHLTEDGPPDVAAAARTNVVMALANAGEPATALMAATEARDWIARLPEGSRRATLLVGVASALERLASQSPEHKAEAALTSASLLTDAARVAYNCGDQRTLAHASGHHAELYAAEGRYAEALELNARALAAATRSNSPFTVFRWQTQQARLLRAAGQIEPAIAAYKQLIGLYAEHLRGTLPDRVADGSFFAAQVRPVFDEAVDLVLQAAAAREEPERRAAELRQALLILETNNTEELRDYFRDDCSKSWSRVEPTRVPGAVVVYPVALPDRLELIVSREDAIESIRVSVGERDLERESEELRRLLGKLYTNEYQKPASQLYEWMIRPMEKQLHGATALVVVPRSSLRTIPIAGLYDVRRQRFLIEGIPVALVPGLSLTEPRAIDSEKADALVAGLSEARNGKPALPSVQREVAAIQALFPARVLLDDAFVESRLAGEVTEQPSTILHIASHAHFGASAAESYVLTHAGPIPFQRFGDLVGASQRHERPLELITLSACETAAGDERAALGLAGAAIRAGARSALATLWEIDDEAASELMAAFYEELRKPGTSRALALQRAQVRLIRGESFGHPGFWSPFVLISSWL